MEDNAIPNNDNNDLLDMAMELKSAVDDFRKAVHDALNQRRELFKLQGDNFNSDKLVLSSIGRRKYIFAGDKKQPVRIREPTWITKREATNLLRISARTLSRYREKKLISFKMVNGAYRYHLDELMAFEGNTKPNNDKTNYRI